MNPPRDAREGSSRTHYDVLGVTSSAEPAEIRRAFRRASRALHPDLGGDAVAYQEVTAAYVVLSSPSARAAYDVELTRGARTSRPARPSPAASGSASSRSGRGYAASPAPSRGWGMPRAGSGSPIRDRPVTYRGGRASESEARTVLHGQVPRRGLFDRSREERQAAIEWLVRSVAREIPALRAVLGVDIPGAGRHDAALVAGTRVLLVDALPTPDTGHTWDGSTLRVGGRVVTVPDTSAAAGHLERTVGGTRADGLVMLFVPGLDEFRPVIDRVGPASGGQGPTGRSRARGDAIAFLAGAADPSLVDRDVLGSLLRLR